MADAERAALPRVLRGLAAAGAPDADALASLWARAADLAVFFSADEVSPSSRVEFGYEDQMKITEH